MKLMYEWYVELVGSITYYNNEVENQLLRILIATQSLVHPRTNLIRFQEKNIKTMFGTKLGRIDKLLKEYDSELYNSFKKTKNRCKVLNERRDEFAHRILWVDDDINSKTIKSIKLKPIGVRGETKTYIFEEITKRIMMSKELVLDLQEIRNNLVFNMEVSKMQKRTEQ